MLLHTLNGETQPVMTAQRTGNTNTELMAAGVGRHLTNITTDELHGIAAIAHKGAMATLGFGRAAVDNGNKIRSYDDSVLAFLAGAFRYDALFENFHF